VGGPKIWPSISPKKTWAGSLGGLATCIVVCVGIGLLLGSADILSFALLGTGLNVAAQLGDFFESALKRWRGVKDSGRVLPGHGGILDRIDSLLFVLPAVLRDGVPVSLFRLTSANIHELYLPPFLSASGPPSADAGCPSWAARAPSVSARSGSRPRTQTSWKSWPWPEPGTWSCWPDRLQPSVPAILGVLDHAGARDLAALLPAGYTPEILVGPSGYATLATLDDADLILAAQVGAAGLVPGPGLGPGRKNPVPGQQGGPGPGRSRVPPELRTERSRDPAGGLGAQRPVPGIGRPRRDAQVSRLILTASGGPFRTKSLEEIQTATPAQALKHPNWSMGAKISIDSATMMNKGPGNHRGRASVRSVRLDEVDVVVHPQSIVHSLVEYSDGSQLAQLGVPDMEIPIGYCLGYPRRLRIGLERLDLAKVWAA
jgi:hypothetical protein